jgi:hypothetical protein
MLQTISNLFRPNSVTAGDDRASVRVLAAAIFILACVAYAPSLKTGFVWDAEGVFIQNPEIQDLANLQGVFTDTQVLKRGNDGKTISSLQYYRPITKAFYILAYSAFGENPLGYKATSLFLHAIVATLAFFLLVSVSSRPVASALAAALFAVNPIHTEAVVWTYSLSYLLMAVFSVATFLLFRKGRMIFALLTCAAALFSHEIGVLLVPMLVIHKWKLEHAESWREYLPLLPFIVLLVVFLVIRSSVVGGIPVSNADYLTFINTAAVVVQRYFKIFFWPDAPVTTYLNEHFEGGSAEVLLSYLLCLALCILAFLFWRRDRQSLFWLLWAGVWVAVSLNVGKFGQYLMAEKILYIASIGISALVIRMVSPIMAKQKKAAMVCFLVLVSASIYHTWYRISFWQDTRTYLTQAIEHAPEFYLAHYALAGIYLREKDYGRAKVYLEKTVEFEPGFSAALSSLGNLHYLNGDVKYALRYWEQAISSDPTNPMPYFNVGLALRKLGMVEESQSYFDRYLENEPNPPPSVMERLKAFGY